MKTPEKNSPQTFRNSVGFIAAILFVLGFAACQQEDEIAPSSRENLNLQHEEPVYHAGATAENVAYGLDNYTLPSSATVPSHSDLASLITASGSLPGIEQQIAVPVRPDVFNVIRIDHFAGRSRLPDYSVTVRSDGLVIYEGRNNVRVRDRVSFMMSGITLPVLKEIFDRAGFYHIVPDFVLKPDMPYVLTSYQPTIQRRPKSIPDNYENIPASLIRIRQEVENLLGIYRFVYDDFPAEPESVLLYQNN